MNTQFSVFFTGCVHMTDATTTFAVDSLKHVSGNVMLADLPESTLKHKPDGEAVELAKKLGLSRQADRYQKGTNGIAQIFATSLLQGEEADVLQWYCPTRYVEGTQQFEGYIFDTIPTAVLKYWAGLKEKYAFDAFEIWTTERTANNDPLLIGVYEGARYLLARWGKEAADLISYAEVRAKICESLCRQFTLEELPAKVAAVITDFHTKILEPVRKMDYWNNGRFFFKKHCGERLMPFNFGTGSRVDGVCASCGTTQRMGNITYDM